MVDFVCENPRSLYQHCVDYIASHLNMVESLVGFPEIVGKDIFKAATDGNKSDMLCFKTLNTRKCIQIFFDAYGNGDILSGLSLEKAHVFLNDVVDDCWYLFRHLSHLDLSSCGIGDDHDVLTMLGGMLRLQTLVLRDNLLTNEGVRRLTAGQRMRRESSSSLKFLDISYNHGITARSVSFLRCLPHMTLLNVSHTSLAFKDAVLLDGWDVCTGQDVCQCMTSCFLVSTVGWASGLLDSWKLHTDVPETRPLKKPSHVARFYSRTKSRTVTKSFNTHHTHQSPNTVSQLILKSHLFSCDHSLPHKHMSAHCSHDNTTSGTSLDQRPFSQNVTSQRVFTNSDSQKQLKTRSSYDEELDDETNVLSQYVCSPPKKRVKKVSLLQQLENFS